MSDHGAPAMMFEGSTFSRSVALLRNDIFSDTPSSSSLASKAVGAFSPSWGVDFESILSRDPRSSPSLNAELSERSAFGDSPCSTKGKLMKDPPVAAPMAVHRETPKSPASSSSSPAKLCSGSDPQQESRPFLRKGARMVRSQPPGVAKRPRASSASERRQRLEPREAFKQAAALTTSTPDAKATAKPRRQARSVPRDGSTALATPQRGRTRASCAMTPAAVSAPAKQSAIGHLGGSPAKVGPSFAWQDPAESAEEPESQDEVLHEQARSLNCSESSASKLAATVLSPSPLETSSVHDDCLVSGLSSNLEEVIMLQRPFSEQDLRLESLVRSATRDLDTDFKEAQSTKASENAVCCTQMNVLDEQILRFQKDNEALARLRKQAELAEAELVRERDILRSEVEEERRALQAQADREREELRRERFQLERDAEAKRREAASERLELRERLDELRKELSGKERHWQKSVDRLQRQVNELSQKNRELSDSYAKTASTCVVRATQTASEADCHSEVSGFEPGADASQQELFGRSPSELSHSETLPELLEVPPLPELAPSASFSKLLVEPEAEAEVSTSVGPSSANDFQQRSPPSTLQTLARARTQSSSAVPRRHRTPLGGATEKFVASSREPASSYAKPGLLIREERGSDGRSERFFEDGRREVLFLSGLRKVQSPDGRMCVFFQNGDVKESLPDGTVIYRYHSTGAVQTTYADGTDVFRFAGGQIECHKPDGSKEIEFANGARKRISADGFEEVSAANSGGVWTAEDAMNYIG